MSITVKQKRFMFGDTFINSELLSALETEYFQDNAPITLNTEEYQGELYAIYQPKDTDDIVLLGNNFNIFGRFLYETFEIMAMLENVTERVYKVSDEFDRKKVIDIIKQVPSDAKVYLQTVADLEQGLKYCLTGVYRCSYSCPAVHLDSYYEEYAFQRN